MRRAHCRWCWGSARALAPKLRFCSTATGRHSRNWRWAGSCVAGPRRHWTFPMACWPIVAISLPPLAYGPLSGRRGSRCPVPWCAGRGGTGPGRAARLADCGHIAAASCVRLVIEQARVPLSDALVRWAGRERALQCGLAGGDDYVLAFALSREELPGLLADGWPIRVIGRVEAGEGVRL